VSRGISGRKTEDEENQLKDLFPTENPLFLICFKDCKREGMRRGCIWRISRGKPKEEVKEKP